MLNMRDIMGAFRACAPPDTPAIIAAQNFKSGVGKSIVTTDLVYYLAVKGYRVLVVDCDSQETTTTLLGFNPHFNVTCEQTRYAYLSIDRRQADLLYAVQKTPWPNVDLIPPYPRHDLDLYLVCSGHLRL
jgi:chromosome partitioning protein